MRDHDADDTAHLTAALREAGAIARKFFGGTYKSWRKETGDPVTEADIAIDSFLKETLLAVRPTYGWLSEESSDNTDRLRAERVFIVDPIDGTYEFLKHLPHFTIVAAVAARGCPVAAAIYNPMTEEMFAATLGHGATMNGKPIHVSAHAELDHASILTGPELMKPVHWATPWPTGITVQNRASIAYRMALVAAGAFDAMLSLSVKADWDLAAGDLIVHEAGGRVSNAENAPLLYNGAPPRQGSIIAAGPRLHARLIARLTELKTPLADFA